MANVRLGLGLLGKVGWGMEGKCSHSIAESGGEGKFDEREIDSHDDYPKKSWSSSGINRFLDSLCQFFSLHLPYYPTLSDYCRSLKSRRGSVFVS